MTFQAGLSLNSIPVSFFYLLIKYFPIDLQKQDNTCGRCYQVSTDLGYGAIPVFISIVSRILNFPLYDS